MNLLIMQSPPVPCYPVFLGRDTFLSILFSHTVSLGVSLRLRNEDSRHCKTTGTVSVLIRPFIKHVYRTSV
jgi:hypothetical protein